MRACGICQGRPLIIKIFYAQLQTAGHFTPATPPNRVVACEVCGPQFYQDSQSATSSPTCISTTVCDCLFTFVTFSDSFARQVC